MEITFKQFDINNPPPIGTKMLVKTKDGHIAAGESMRWLGGKDFSLSPLGFSGYEWEWDFEPSDIVEWADISDI